MDAGKWSCIKEAQHRLGGLVAAALLVSTLLFPPALLAEVAPSCAPSSAFPSGYIPFSSVFYITPPDSAGDRLVVGSVTAPAFNQLLQSVPLPSGGPNQVFCDPVELAPGLTVPAYVPTAAERNGGLQRLQWCIVRSLYQVAVHQQRDSRFCVTRGFRVENPAACRPPLCYGAQC